VCLSCTVFGFFGVIWLPFSVDLAFFAYDYLTTLVRILHLLSIQFTTSVVVSMKPVKKNYVC